MLLQIIPFLTASILLTLSPGPDIIYVLVQSMTNGKKAGIMTALGLVSGILIHASLVALGVSAIIKESETLFWIIKIFGAGYLFYLAYKVYGSDGGIKIESSKKLPTRKIALLKQGFIMNVLNPKVTIFFLAFFPGFLWDTEGNTVLQFYILGFLFMIQAMVIFGLIALISGKISKYLLQHPRSGVILKWIQVVVFIAIGVLILI